MIAKAKQKQYQTINFIIRIPLWSSRPEYKLNAVQGQMFSEVTTLEETAKIQPRTRGAALRDFVLP